MQTDLRRLPSSRKKPKAKGAASTGRPDPAPRPMDGIEPMSMLDPSTTDPNMDYRWASSAYHYQPCSVEDYQLKGWKVQTYQASGVKPLVDTYGEEPKPGSPIERPGMVLMAKPKVAAQAEWRAGQDQVDAAERFIRNGSEFGHGKRNRAMRVAAKVGELERLGVKTAEDEIDEGGDSADDSEE